MRVIRTAHYKLIARSYTKKTQKANRGKWRLYVHSSDAFIYFSAI